MTTITIDSPLQLRKTHFATLWEATLFLIEQQSLIEDKDWIVETPQNILAYEQSLQWENEHFSLSQAKQLILWNVK